MIPDDDMMRTILTVSGEVEAAATPRCVCARFELIREQDTPVLLGTAFALQGKAIGRHLTKADKCIVLAATLGVGVDTIVRRYQAASPHRALIADACANALIEDFCDQIQEAAKTATCGEAQMLTSRFSPGYSDMPLETHDWLLPLLDTNRKIGLFKTPQQLLTPMKSVTAFMGIVPRLENRNRSFCANCTENTRCQYKGNT